MPIPRLHPYASPPYLPILGARSISPPSAHSQARSPTHLRRFQDPDCGTYPVPTRGTCRTMLIDTSSQTPLQSRQLANCTVLLRCFG
jgi:hypothetical protein